MNLKLEIKERLGNEWGLLAFKSDLVIKNDNEHHNLAL
jgi:hypothetical protein